MRPLPCRPEDVDVPGRPRGPHEENQGDHNLENQGATTRKARGLQHRKQGTTGEPWETTTNDI